MRVRSGPAAKTHAERVLSGTARPAKADEPSAIQSQIADVSAPADLAPAPLALWQQLAPFALAQRTLTPATVQAFCDLLEAIVVKREMQARIDKEGQVLNLVSGKKAHPLLGHHRGMMQRVELGMARFKLAPIGRELFEPAAPDDPFSEFEDTPGVRPTH